MNRTWKIAPRLIRMALAATACGAIFVQPAKSLELGRLFYTPEQRGDMDRKRYTKPPAPKIEAPAAAAPAPVAPSSPHTVTLEGYVSRSSGHSTEWVNGVPQNDRLHVQGNDVRLYEGKQPID